MYSCIKRALCVVLALQVCLPHAAWATWSIIVLDRASNRVAVAAASCTSDVYGVMALFPGVGALVAQGMGHPPAMREAMRLLQDGQSVDSVVRAITSRAVDSVTAQRQYGIATFSGGQRQFSGTDLTAYHGERSAEDILVQGNTLAGPAVLDRALAAIQTARAEGRPLEEVAMAGLKAGADAGGDVRCGDQRATSAFLAVAKPGDVPNWPYLTLRVVGVEKSWTINAVDVLQSRLILWQQSGGRRNRLTSETVRPDSAD
jgi:uncharacterized Ntn-hydrolase superfamily protein